MRAKYRNRIAELRERKGWRQVDLARAVQAVESQISKLERFELPMSQDWMYRIAKALECDPWELLPEWAERSAGQHIETLWPRTCDEDKERLIRKYLAVYEDFLCAQRRAGTPIEFVHAETEGAVATGSTLMLIEVAGDNLKRVTYYRPVVPEKDGSSEG